MKTLAAALVLVLALVAAVAPAEAAFPGSAGRVAFESAGDIYTVNRDGTGFRRLTTGGASHSPKWSPDGARIAFNRRGEIWVIGADGLNARRVTTTGRNFQPDWSPDGSRLVYVHVPAGSGGDIWTTPVAGGTPTRITNVGGTGCGNSRPTWSPLGGRIAYERSVRASNGVCVEGGIAVLRLSDRAITATIGNFSSRPDFTADGEGLVFDGRDAFGTENLLWSSLAGRLVEPLTSFFCAEGEQCFQEGGAAPSSDFAARAHYLAVSSGFFLDENDLEVTFACVTTVAFASRSFCTHRVTWSVPEFPRNVDWQSR